MENAILQFLLMYTAQGVITALIFWLYGRARPVSITWLNGNITHSRIVVDTAAGLSMALSCAAFQRHFYFFAHPYTLTIGLVCAFLTLILIGLLRPGYAVTWDEHHISGPTSFALWPLHPDREICAWEDIKSVGTDWLGSYYLQTRSGEWIRWTCLYRRHSEAAYAVTRARPDLFPDLDFDDNGMDRWI